MQEFQKKNFCAFNVKNFGIFKFFRINLITIFIDKLKVRTTTFQIFFFFTIIADKKRSLRRNEVE